MTKTPTPTEQSKKQRDNIKTPPKTLITQLLRTDLGRSVGVTADFYKNFNKADFNKDFYKDFNKADFNKDFFRFSKHGQMSMELRLKKSVSLLSPDGP